MRNSEAHIYWYLGDFPSALAAANTLLDLVEREQLGNYRVLAHTLLGNLRRELGDYAAAAAHYTTARTIAHEVHYVRFIPWIDVQTGWLHILQGALDEGRRYIHASLATSDRGQAMSFRVFLATLESLEGRYAVAEDLLRRSLDFYRRSGDTLAIHAILLHLAYISLHAGDAERAREYLSTALGWMNEREVDYVPLWWHPTVIGYVCAYALSSGIHADLAERILLLRLGRQGSSALEALLTRENLVNGSRMRQILRHLTESAYPELNDIDDEKLRQVLIRLLDEGKLAAAGLADLRTLLVTASTRQQANPTILAVFALYINGWDRVTIADALGCAESTVRNYITDIYQIFDLPQRAWKGRRRARKQRLVKLARERGFV